MKSKKSMIEKWINQFGDTFTSQKKKRNIEKWYTKIYNAETVCTAHSK